MIKEAIAKLIEGLKLNALEMRQVMEEILGGIATPSQIAAFLVLLASKGETPQELTAAVEVMRKHCLSIKVKREVILDTCGTGGDRKGTFNISTAAAFVASGAGAVVAKHGNRSVSSRCGSADILEALGVNIHLEAERIKQALEEIGIAFLFAPNFHPAMKYAAPVRKELGVRTMFNLLGPLVNPVGVTRQLIGVYARPWTIIMAEVLRNLGTRHAMVVHGADGLDEISNSKITFVSELKNGRIKNYQINPKKFGFRPSRLNDLCGESPEFNAQVLTGVLKNAEGFYRDAVLINAGAAIYIADLAKSIGEGIELARQSISSGAALKKLEMLREFSKG